MYPFPQYTTKSGHVNTVQSAHLCSNKLKQNIVNNNPSF